MILALEAEAHRALVVNYDNDVRDVQTPVELPDKNAAWLGARDCILAKVEANRGGART